MYYAMYTLWYNNFGLRYAVTVVLQNGHQPETNISSSS